MQPVILILILAVIGLMIPPIMIVPDPHIPRGFDTVRRGMTRDDVLALLGPPTHERDLASGHRISLWETKVHGVATVIFKGDDVHQKYFENPRSALDKVSQAIRDRWERLGRELDD